MTRGICVHRVAEGASNLTNFRNFDLNLLLMLDGVLREGTHSNAAKAMNVSWPTISSSLAKLREILQDELFVRCGNGMQPTPRALALKRWAPGVELPRRAAYDVLPVRAATMVRGI